VSPPEDESTTVDWSASAAEGARAVAEAVASGELSAATEAERWAAHEAWLERNGDKLFTTEDGTFVHTETP
jgi:hypothetical protein